MNVSVHEAKTHLSRLLVRVEAGEDVVISRGGTPIARLVPIASVRRRPLIGALKGRVNLDRFDEPLPDELLKFFEHDGNIEHDTE